jgi:hypothetical protein
MGWHFSRQDAWHATPGRIDSLIGTDGNGARVYRLDSAGRHSVEACPSVLTDCIPVSRRVVGDLILPSGLVRRAAGISIFGA